MAILLHAPAFAQDVVDPASVADAAPADTIVVTGSRLATAGFNAPTPVTVVGAADIARQGATTVSEVLNLLPAFRALNTPATAAIYANNIGTNTADLRALGPNRTLVLVDGRRVVPATVQGSSFVPAGVVDLNIIPTSLIRQSEVVTGGASAAYGSDAVAGVVNILLDTKFEGFRGSLQYGQTEIGDGKTYAGSLAFGTRLGDRGHLIAGVDYSNDRGTGDCYTRSWCAPGSYQVTNPNRNNGIPAVNLLPYPTIATATNNGIITAGPLQGLEFAPDGQSVARHDYGTYYGAGLFQGGGGDGRHPFWENLPLSAPVRRYATLAHLDYELSDTLTAFAELSYADTHGRTVGAQTRDTGNITIRSDNPYLPPAVVAAMQANNITSFAFGRIGNDLGPSQARVDRSVFRGVGGFRGTFANNWEWSTYYQYGRTKYRQVQTNTRINDNFTRAVDAVRGPNGNIVCRVNADTIATNDDPACSPLNLFGANNFSQQAKAYTYGTAYQDTILKQQVFAGQLSGDLIDLWAGPLSFAIGGEWRKDQASGTADPISTAFRFYTGPGAAISGQVTVKEGFIEAGLPLARDAAFAHALDINGAVRLTDYSTSGSVTSWKAGVTWEPVRQLRLRATRSRDIRAPNIFELYGPRQTSFQTINDPARGGASALPLSILGGNANLKPEIAKTLTVGAVLLPDFWGLDRLRFSVDYYDIKLSQAINTLGSQLILDLCFRGNAALCAQVERDGAGNVVSISNTNLNLNRIDTRGIDFELAYAMPLSDLSNGLGGQLSTRVLATKIMRLRTIDPTGAAIDRVGQLGPPTAPSIGGLPNWQGTASLTYAKGPFSGTLQLRYVASGKRDVTLIGPEEAGYSPSLPNSVNRNRVPAFTYANLNLQYALVDDGKRRVELFAVVNNLFDKDPPNYLPFFWPTNPVLYDTLGRAYRGGVRVSF